MWIGAGINGSSKKSPAEEKHKTKIEEAKHLESTRRFENPLTKNHNPHRGY